MKILVDEWSLSAPELPAQLSRAQHYGWVGQGPLAQHVAHSLAFGEAVGLLASDCAVDLGAGGGLPGLVLACLGPAATWHLLDAQLDRAEFLDTAVQALGLGDRVTVHHGRAEDFARGELRGCATLVTARSFGPPPMVAENGAPLLRQGGRLGVSEPPGAHDRWDVVALGLVGLGAPRRVRSSEGTFAVMECVSVSDARYPRRIKPQRANPLF